MIIDIFKRLWKSWPAGCVIIITQLSIMVLILAFTFTNIWPAAHDWLNSVPCPTDQSCPELHGWFW